MFFIHFFSFLTFKEEAWRVVKILSCYMILQINCMLQVNVFSSFFLSLVIVF